jgi:hypothetical protein
MPFWKGGVLKTHRKSPPRHSDESILHFRLCHFCYFLNESESEINRCARCEKDFYSIHDYLISDENEVEFDPDGDPLLSSVEAGARENDCPQPRYYRPGRRIAGLIAIL